MNFKLKINPEDVKGFNYHPSYSTGSLEDWLMFDYNVWEKELKNGKKLFPKMNTIRIWLSWNAFCRLEDKFIEEVRQVIDLCKELDLCVIPCLFNRWHDAMVDCDGIYIDHFLPGSSWLLKYGNLFEDYIDAICKAFKDEEQILVWDLCNEPYAYDGNFPLRDEVLPHEYEWLKKIHNRMRDNNVTQPLGVGGICIEHGPYFEEFSDILLTHIYFTNFEKVGHFDEKVKNYMEYLKAKGKSLIVTECCWGSFDDETRVRYIKETLDVLTKYGAGYTVHALQYSGCADLHDFGDGRTSPDIGNLCFVKKDGTLRPGHDIFNDY